MNVAEGSKIIKSLMPEEADWRRLQRFLSSRCHCDRPEWLDAATAGKAIEGLKAMLARERRKAAR